MPGIPEARWYQADSYFSSIGKQMCDFPFLVQL